MQAFHGTRKNRTIATPVVIIQVFIYQCITPTPAGPSLAQNHSVLRTSRGEFHGRRKTLCPRFGAATARRLGRAVGCDRRGCWLWLSRAQRFPAIGATK